MNSFIKTLLLTVAMTTASASNVFAASMSCEAFAGPISIQATTLPNSSVAQVQLSIFKGLECKDPHQMRTCRHLAFAEPLGKPFQVSVRQNGLTIFFEAPQFQFAIKPSPYSENEEEQRFNGLLLRGNEMNGTKISPQFYCSFKK